MKIKLAQTVGCSYVGKKHLTTGRESKLKKRSKPDACVLAFR